MKTNIFYLYLLRDGLSIAPCLYIKADSADTVRAYVDSAKFDYWCTVPHYLYEQTANGFEVKPQNKLYPIDTDSVDIDVTSLEAQGLTPREIRQRFTAEMINHTIID